MWKVATFSIIIYWLTAVGISFISQDTGIFIGQFIMATSLAIALVAFTRWMRSRVEKNQPRKKKRRRAGQIMMPLYNRHDPNLSQMVEKHKKDELIIIQSTKAT